MEVDEPQLALSFFEMVKTWVKELITLVNTTQSGNQASISQVRGGVRVRKCMKWPCGSCNSPFGVICF